MSQSSRWSSPDFRWLLLSHALFAITLAVPTLLVMFSDTPARERAITVGVALAFAGWYAWFAAHPRWLQESTAAVVYSVGLLAFYTVLSTRGEAYFLLIYSLVPLLFSTLRRVAAVIGTVSLVVLPVVVGSGLDGLFQDRTLFNLLPTVGLGLVITAIIEALARRTEQRSRPSANWRRHDPKSPSCSSGLGKICAPVTRSLVWGTP